MFAASIAKVTALIINTKIKADKPSPQQASFTRVFWFYVLVKVE